jgi:tRNA G37 N-methylase Trm5
MEKKKENDKEKKIRSFDLLGNTALVRFPENFSIQDKKKFALDLMKKQKSVRTVLEKVGEIKED